MFNLWNSRQRSSFLEPGGAPIRRASSPADAMGAPARRGSSGPAEHLPEPSRFPSHAADQHPSPLFRRGSFVPPPRQTPEEARDDCGSHVQHAPPPESPPYPTYPNQSGGVLAKQAQEEPRGGPAGLSDRVPSGTGAAWARPGSALAEQQRTAPRRRGLSFRRAAGSPDRAGAGSLLDSLAGAGRAPPSANTAEYDKREPADPEEALKLISLKIALSGQPGVLAELAPALGQPPADALQQALAKTLGDLPFTLGQAGSFPRRPRLHEASADEETMQAITSGTASPSFGWALDRVARLFQVPSKAPKHPYG